MLSAPEWNVVLNIVTIVGALVSLCMILSKIDTLSVKVNDTNAKVNKYLRD